jgi:hypothetical protein
MDPPGSRRGERRGRARALLPGAVIALAFLFVGLSVLDDFGMTWDENESYGAGLQNLEIVRTVAAGGTDFAWPWHELRGYQFLFDTARAGFALLVAPAVGGPGLRGPGLAPVPIEAFHLFHLLLSSATLFLTYAIALEVSGRVRTGVLSALVLATTPKFVAHSQNNPKDAVGLLVFALAVWAVARATRAVREGAGRGAFGWAGAAVGLAFASHVLSALLVPVAGLWLLWRHPGPVRRRLAALAVLFGAAAAVAFLLWPWLWGDPLIRTARIVRRVATYEVPIAVLYLGRIYAAAATPWHYFLGSLLAATPVAFTLAALLGAGEAFRSRSPGDARPRDGRPEAPSHLAVLALLWLAVPVAVEAFAGARYDGVRHLLVVLPALALLAGVGLDRLLALARTAVAPPAARAAARAAAVAAAGAWLWLLADLARYHPYQDAYLNAAVRAALDRPAEEVFELEYWGSSLKEGAAWLNANAPPGSRVLVPVAAHCAVPYLARDLVLVAPDPPTAWAEADYQMAITRRAFYTPQVHQVRKRGRPVFTIERPGGTLLETYRLVEPRPGFR